jgi:hypothetical protein
VGCVFVCGARAPAACARARVCAYLCVWVCVCVVCRCKLRVFLWHVLRHTRVARVCVEFTVTIVTHRYADDEIFVRAIRLLNRRYGQRRKLLSALQDVILLDRTSLPVFDNLAKLEADLGFLRFLLRSSEVWGVKSKLSGDFNHEVRVSFSSPHLVGNKAFIHLHSNSTIDAQLRRWRRSGRSS